MLFKKITFNKAKKTVATTGIIYILKYMKIENSYFKALGGNF